MVEEDFEWDEEVQPDDETSYQALLRGIKRANGFCLQFVQCTPIKAKEIIEKLETDLAGQKIAKLVIDAETDNFYERISERYQTEQFDVVFVQGLEDPMLVYEQRQGKDILELSREKGYGGKGWENVPLILGNINLSREKLRDNFPLTLVFFLPEFALNYFIRRSPDFFDWRSNTFSFRTDEQQLESEYQRLSFDESGFEKYIKFSSSERVAKIKEIASYLNEVTADNERANLWFEKGSIHLLGAELEDAISSYDKALTIEPDKYGAWNNRSGALFLLGRYEEAITSCDKSLEIKPDDHGIWYGRGNILHQSGRYEEAVASYDKALEIKPDFHEAWNNRGNTLGELGRYEEAILSHEKAFDIRKELGDHQSTIQSLQALIALHRSLGNVKQILTLSQQMIALMQEDENWLEELPIQKWQKGLLQFSQKGWLQAILGIGAIVIASLIMLPFNLCIVIWRKIKTSLN